MKKALIYAISATSSLTMLNGELSASTLASEDQKIALEEIIVSAQKTEKPLQETPIAVSVLGTDDLEANGISSLSDLESGLIPSLRIMPYSTAPSTLILSIRGFGPTDAGQGTRETSVAMYKDGFFLGRAQSLAMELMDLERVEVFRGPQGSMFGRNATGGAVNLVSQKPTGEFNFKQTVGYGNYDALRSSTRLDLPEFSGIRIKLDYMHSEKDGWVKNLAEDQADYSASNMDAGGITIDADLSETLNLSYDLDLSHIEVTQDYYQIDLDNIGFLGAETERVKETRFPVTPLSPTVSRHQMHSLTLSWKATEEITVKSLTSYRELDEEARVNWAGALYFNGFAYIETMDQEQWTQEIQVIGTHDRLEWVAGLYYFEEDVRQTKDDYFSLDLFGLITGTPLTPLSPLVQVDPITIANLNTKSKAIYGQATWTPAVLEDRLKVTVGLRYTDDSRVGNRVNPDLQEADLQIDQLDPLITLSYQWTDDVLAYAKWSSAFKAGGVNFHSTSFGEFGAEQVETYEIGLKSDLLDNRLRINAALFSTYIDNAQIDFLDPNDLTVLETFNAAENPATIKGAELEIRMVPLPGLHIGLNYTYLDGDIPDQPNPLAGGILQPFTMPQTPEHAGSVTVDYSFPPTSIGTIALHADMTATDTYSYVAFGTQDLDSYALFNAKATLTDIPLGNNGHNLQISFWVKNLTDEAYVVNGFPVAQDLLNTVTYGQPRTYGLDLTYKF